MKEIFSRRLKNARIMAGLSQDQLVKQLGNIISKNAISKYEQGEMMADSKILHALANALNVKMDYFFSPFSIEISQVDFRKKSRLSAKEMAFIRQKATDFIERYIEVEKFLNIKSDFINPLAGFVIKSESDVEKAAEQLLFEWKLGFNGLPKVIDILEDHEIKVLEIESSLAFDGLSGWADSNIPVIVLNRNYAIERKRLTALHELGHLLLTFHASVTSKEIEKACHQFAGAILIPKATFIKEIGEHRTQISISELIVIKETYGISVQAIMARAKILGIINESLFITFRKKISQNLTENGLGQYAGKEEPMRFRQLIYHAAAEQLMSLSKAANLSNQKLADFRQNYVSL